MVDIDLPGTDGLTAAAELHGRCPDRRVLILTVLGKPGNLRRAPAAHVAGFLPKGIPATELVDAVRNNPSASGHASRMRREAVMWPSLSGSAAAGAVAADAVAALHRRHMPWGADHDSAPEGRLLLDELSRLAGHAIESLPPRERAVITLRSIEGYSPEEVCRLLRISDASQRAALHRARSKSAHASVPTC